MKNSTLLFALFLLVNSYFFAQNSGVVGINTTSPNGILDISATTTGMLYPRVALTDINTETITNPSGGSIVAGTTVYNTTASGTGASAVFPGIYVWDGTYWIPQFHKRNSKICYQNSSLRTGSDDILNPILGDQTISFDDNTFTPIYDGVYQVTLTVHFGGGALDAPNYANDQWVNFQAQEGEFDFTFNGTTHTFSLKSYSGSNDDKLFDGGTFDVHTNRVRQCVFKTTETLTRNTLYLFSLTFNQVPANGFEADGDNILLEDGRGYISINNDLKCSVEFRSISN
ncbi:MAG: hypothetical protein R2793_04295 [Flavobacteriaceae bacterium]